MSMRILVDMGRVLGAQRLTPIASAHIDGCLYHGPAGVDFAERLVAGGGRAVVPTTLNIGSLDLKRPDIVRLEEPDRALAHRLMMAYLTLQCAPTWTCAPYQAGHRPALGEDIAWAESNAVVFANSVLGARTNRYGDFLDIAAALTGRAPYYGLHLPEERLARILITTETLSPELKRRDAFYPVLGAWLGRQVGATVAAIDGLPPDTTEDQLKALGAAAASSGAVGLFHVIGVTPEARTFEQAFGGKEPQTVLPFDLAALKQARDTLSTSRADTLDVVALGSPHFSYEEFRRFETLLGEQRTRVPVYVCTGRHVTSRMQAEGRLDTLIERGVRIVEDTCVVSTPVLEGSGGVLMTNSGKFAHYTPANTGYEVVFGPLEDCVNSAVLGKVVRDERWWS